MPGGKTGHFQGDPTMSTVPLAKRCAAEFLGTAWLVFGGCGSAVLAAHFLASDNPNVNMGIGFVGVALAFGLTLLTMAYAIGHISGCHINPAVSIGLWAGKRFPASDLLPYIVSQVLGGVVGASILYIIASGQAGFNVHAGFASNGYGAHSPGHYPLLSCLVSEVVLTFMFLMIILGATDGRAPKGFAPIAIGLGLTLVHLIGIPVDNLSVNPARSTGPALFCGGWALAQLWLFWLAPIVGGALACAIAGWKRTPGKHRPHQLWEKSYLKPIELSCAPFPFREWGVFLGQERWSSWIIIFFSHRCVRMAKTVAPLGVRRFHALPFLTFTLCPYCCAFRGTDVDACYCRMQREWFKQFRHRLRGVPKYHCPITDYGRGDGRNAGHDYWFELIDCQRCPFWRDAGRELYSQFRHVYDGDFSGRRRHSEYHSDSDLRQQREQRRG
jgi:aquaporin Z